MSDSPKYKFNPQTRLFTDANNKPISAEQLQKIIAVYQKQHLEATLTNSTDILVKTGTVSEWELSVAASLREATLANFIVLNPDVTEQDFKPLELRLTKQFQELRKVSQQIAQGDLTLEEIQGHVTELVNKAHSIAQETKPISPIKPTADKPVIDEPEAKPVNDITFGFNKISQRYHYLTGEKKGQFLSKNKSREIFQDYLESHKSELFTYHQQLEQGKLSLAEWEVKMAESMRSATVNAYKIANPLATEQNWDIVSDQLKQQFLYLRNFTKQIQEGQLSISQIDARADQYIQACWGFYSEATRDAHENADYKWERRFIASKHPCPQCPEYAAQGWQKIGTLPGIGEQCQCKSNCKCYFEFSLSSGRPQESLSVNLWQHYKQILGKLS